MATVILLLLGMSPSSGDDGDPEVQKWLQVLGTDEPVRFRALNELIRLGDKSIAPARKVLNDRQQATRRRWQAAKLLGALKARQAVPDLLAVFTGDDHVSVKQTAAEALGRIGDRSVLPALRKALAQEADATTRQVIEQATATLEGRQPPLVRGAQPDTATSRESDFWEQRFAWAASIAEGRQRSQERERLLLTVVYAYESEARPPGTLDRAELPYHALLRGPLADPDLTALLTNHFVLAKVRLPLRAFSTDYPPLDPDPLAPLRVSSRRLRPPALVITNTAGEPIHTVSGLGVFNARLLHATLLAVLRASGRTPPPHTLVSPPGDAAPTEHGAALTKSRIEFLAGNDATALALLDPLMATSAQARALSLRGKILHHRGDYAAAVQSLQRALALDLTAADRGETQFWLADCEIAQQRFDQAAARLRELARATPRSVWSGKAAAWLNDAGLDLRQAESFAAVDSPAPITKTEQQRSTEQLDHVVTRAVRFLIGQQQADGGWRNGGGGAVELSAVAITSICAGALRDWRKALPAGLQADVEQALQRGLARVLRFAENPGKQPSEVWNHTYALELILDVLEDSRHDEQLRMAAGRLVRALGSHQYPDGGWSYLTVEAGARFGGLRPHSFNTGPILVELDRARRLGIDVPPDMIARGGQSLKSMRSADGAFAYAPPQGFQWMTRQRAAVARDSICELGLLAAGIGDPGRVAEAVQRFHVHRRDLEIPRKLYASYFNSHGHGAYFYAFGYYYAAKALRHVPPPLRRQYALEFQQDLLAIVELDGTWIDSHASGKSYATGMTLRALRQLANAINHG